MLVVSNCVHVSNSEIWSTYPDSYITLQGYADSTYSTDKKEGSSPLDEVNPVTFVLKGSIFLYQELLSSQDGHSCPFRPSCSHYGADAVKKYNVVGAFLAGERLLRCNGMSLHGYQRIEGSHYYYDPLISSKKEDIKSKKDIPEGM